MMRSIRMLPVLLAALTGTQSAQEMNLDLQSIFIC